MTNRSKFDWEAIIKFNIYLLKITGLWLTSEYNFYRVVYTFVVLILFLGMDTSCQIINLYFIRHDLKAVTGTIFILITKIASCFKSYLVIKDRRLFKNIMVFLQSDLFQPQNKQQLSLIQPNFNIWNRQFYGIWSCTFGCLSFMLVSPLFDKRKYLLPALSWYPFDYKEDWIYHIVYVHQALSTTICATVNVSIDTLVSGLNMYITSQLGILCDNLEHAEASKPFVKCKLRNCVRQHKLILSFTTKCNMFLNWIIFIQFFVSTVSIGITMFQLTVVLLLSSEFYGLLCFEIGILVEIYMYCWFGDQIKYKSNQIVTAAYKSNWQTFSDSNKKRLIIFLINSQKPLAISSMNIFDLTIENFVKILKTAWSYFALLHQISSVG